MKSILLITALFFFANLSAQTVKDQKVSFKYIQLPSNPIKGVSSYSVVVDHSVYRASNEDSLNAFEVKLNLAESQLDAWISQKKKIDKAYLLEMAKWQKATNAGTPYKEPIKGQYPEMPTLKEELLEPLVMEDINEDLVDQKVKLQGFSKGSGGAVITIQFQGFLESVITNKVKGSGASAKLDYKLEYKMPVIVKVEVPGSGIIMEETINTRKKSKDIKSFPTKYDYEYWKIDNLNNFWKTTQQEEVAKILQEVDNLVNDYCGFPEKTRSTEVHTVKKHKGHSYSDLTDAYSKAKSGYALVIKNKDRTGGSSKLNAAISKWESALTESNVLDKKSRINKKVTSLLYVNIAEAYLWQNDFDNADKYIQLAKLGGVMKYNGKAKRLEKLMNDMKSRKLAND